MASINRIFPSKAPKAVGPYSPLTHVNDLVFLSGQLPINPLTNNIDAQDIQSQIKQVMENLKVLLEEVSLGFSDVVKTTILLTDMNHFAKVNQIYGSYFDGGKYPSRMTYAVAALPKGSLVEIDAIAYKSQHNHHANKQIISPANGPKPNGCYSHAIAASDYIFISGQIPIDPQTNNIQAKDIQGQTHQVMKNLKAILDQAQLTFSDLTKTTILLTDLSNFVKVNQIYGSYFPSNQYPARMTYQVVALPKNSMIQIDGIAYRRVQGHEQDITKKKVKPNST